LLKLKSYPVIYTRENAVGCIDYVADLHGERGFELFDEHDLVALGSKLMKKMYVIFDTIALCAFTASLDSLVLDEAFITHLLMNCAGRQHKKRKNWLCAANHVFNAWLNVLLSDCLAVMMHIGSLMVLQGLIGSG
jgi:hypothetical protein